MAVGMIALQPAGRFRLLPPGVTGLCLGRMLARCGMNAAATVSERPGETILRASRLLLDRPGEMAFAWHFLDNIGCVWLDGGGANAVDESALSAAIGLPVIRGGGGLFAAEEGGLAMLDELGCRGMVIDLGQSVLKVSWAGRRRAFPRDPSVLPHDDGTVASSVLEKGAQRRALRRFIAESVRSVLAGSDDGTPEGVVFALPSDLDRWGQPAGSSYIGMAMDTQLATDSLELAGLGNMRHWVVNDAELVAASAVFDERIFPYGRALVFSAGTAIGAALADPVAAAFQLSQSDAPVQGG